MFQQKQWKNMSKQMILVSLQFLLATTTMLLRWENCSGFPIAHTLVVNDRSGACANNFGHQRKTSERNIRDKRSFQSPTLPFSLQLPCLLSTSRIAASSPPRVWIEEAEEGFVDDEENLEPGEVCLRSIKSFASGVPLEGAVAAAASNNRAAPGDTNTAPSIRVDFDIKEEEEEECDRRFLSAGALVQRPRYDDQPENSNGSHPNSDNTGICNAWVADSLLKEGGPNLQLMGALLVLDDLFLHHLQRERENYHRSMLEHDKNCSSGNNNNNINNKHRTPTATTNDGNDKNYDDSWAIRALRNFVVRCGDDDDDDDYEEEDKIETNNTGDRRPWRSTSHVTASAMAASMRGFVPLREMTRIDSVYDARYYYDGDTTGLVLDPSAGFDRYRTCAVEIEIEMEAKAEVKVKGVDDTGSGHLEDGNSSAAAGSIASLLPSEETVAQHTTKRFTIHRRREGGSQ